MLEYCSEILQKVSFSPDLFGRELKKSIKMVEKDEVMVLKTWCILSYGNEHKDIIQDVFGKVHH